MLCKLAQTNQTTNKAMTKCRNKATPGPGLESSVRVVDLFTLMRLSGRDDNALT